MVNIVRHRTVPQAAWSRSAITFSVVALIVAISAVLAGPVPGDAPDRHEPHVLASTAQHAVASAGLDHPHIQRDNSVAAPDVFATAVLPRAATMLVVLAIVVAVAAVWLWQIRAAAATQRAPPPLGVCPISGRALLVRFCIDRC